MKYTEALNIVKEMAAIEGKTIGSMIEKLIGQAMKACPQLDKTWDKAIEVIAEKRSQ